MSKIYFCSASRLNFCGKDYAIEDTFWSYVRKSKKEAMSNIKQIIQIDKQTESYFEKNKYVVEMFQCKVKSSSNSLPFDDFFLPTVSYFKSKKSIGLFVDNEWL